ncbi:nitrate ABC transporter substrate-binding protein [Enemella dayhoffiae]|uniref:Nitrate ABC transporter substrate-binding protein n=1 Tax=Enemella dayhoffiae TaxID=2016507 RepID=A0A255GYX6_9ACTN|nr:ABC transporter substrate-binding protein [Enemella dayhoffiae]OYO20798.1 nitrate ABC transporter substrate-binding protein [Enemella dayhoffiae]
MLTRLRAIPLAAATILALTLCACGGGAAPSKDQPTKLTIGLIPIVDVAPLYLGIKQGYFKEEGIELDPVLAAGGAAIVPAVTSNSYQIGFSNNVSLIIGVSKGLPLQMVSPGVAISPANRSSNAAAGYCSVVTAGDSAIKGTADLPGKTVAVNTLNNIGDVTIRAALEAEGVNPAGVRFTELPFPDMVAAVEQKRIDAAWVCEPFVTKLTGNGARAILDNYAKTDPNLSVASYFAAKPWAQKNPELLAGFRRAMDKSMKFASQNPDAVRAVLPEYTSIDPATASKIGLPSFPTDFNEPSLNKLIEQSKKQGLLGDKPVTVQSLTAKQ